MKQQRFCGLSLAVLTILPFILLTSINATSYAGNHSAATHGSAMRPLTTVVPRAFLALDSQAPSHLDPNSHLSVLKHDDTMETLARISVVGGLLLTADRLVRSMDSMKDTPLLLRGDGSSIRFNAVNKGFLVGFTVSRPLDF